MHSLQLVIALLLIAGVWLVGLAGKTFGSFFKLSKDLLILSAGFLIALTVTELFPEIYKGDSHTMGLWILGGVLLQMILENLTKGFEHGHMHHTTQDVFPAGLALGLFLHAFLEGIPLSGIDRLDAPYLLGILVHNVPISFLMGAFMLNGAGRKKGFWKIFLLFSLASPLGMLLGNSIDAVYHHYIIALVAGVFLHISSVIIFESNKQHKMDWKKLMLVIGGIALAMLSHTFHYH